MKTLVIIVEDEDYENVLTALNTISWDTQDHETEEEYTEERELIPVTMPSIWDRPEIEEQPNVPGMFQFVDIASL